MFSELDILQTLVVTVGYDCGEVRGWAMPSVVILCYLSTSVQKSCFENHLSTLCFALLSKLELLVLIFPPPSEFVVHEGLKGFLHVARRGGRRLTTLVHPLLCQHVGYIFNTEANSADLQNALFDYLHILTCTFCV